MTFPLRTKPAIFVALALAAAAGTCLGPMGDRALAQPPAPAPAHPVRTLMALDPAEVAPLTLLPAPPADGSPEQQTEIAELDHLQAIRTPERLAQAEWDGAHEDASAFAAVMGPRFDLSRMPATARLLRLVQNDGSVAAKMAKTAFHRHRPWIFDQRLNGCEENRHKDPLTSYPSGHATMGYALAVTLASLAPERGPKIMDRAAQYAQSRLVCGVHFRSDVVAGQALGTTVAVLILHDPKLQGQVSAARSELAALGD